LKFLDGSGKGTEGLSIEEIRGLIEDEEVGLVPHGGGQHELDLREEGREGGKEA